jgi:anti-sigma regulatory factor (Ser/Thr protein kinase)
VAPFRHEALLYAGLDGFLDGTLSFVRGALEADEPILVAVGAGKIAALRGELGAAADGVAFADMAEIGANPSRIIPAWREFLGLQARRRGAIRGIGEPIWAGRTRAELVECQRHESLLNLAFAGTPAFRLMCPYDTAALGADVIEEAERSHPHVVEAGQERDSATYRGLDAVAEPFDVPLPEPPAGADELRFGASSLTLVRDFVARAGERAGLGVDGIGDLVLAIAEVTGNSIRHGGGRGVVRTWEEPGALVVEVEDGGLIDDPLAGRRRPDPAQVGGWGLWLANQLCDLVQVRASRVRLHMYRD